MSRAETIQFTGRLRYRHLPKIGPTPGAEIILRIGDRESAALFGILDSGSSVTVIQKEYADLLGIDDITSSGVRRRVSTAAGSITIYLFDVEMEILLESSNEKITCQIGFAEENIPRCILGRNIFFEEFTLAFLERNQEVLYRKVTP